MQTAAKWSVAVAVLIASLGLGVGTASAVQPDHPEHPPHPSSPVTVHTGTPPGADNSNAGGAKRTLHA